MEDIILQRLFEQDRWEKALEKAATEKHMDLGDIRKLTDPDERAKFYLRIKNGTYKIAPPHMQLIPKDKPGEFRTVYINENMDRIFLSIMNDMMFEMLPEFIHPQCKSYQTGIGCGKVVQEAVGKIKDVKDVCFGFKADLSKYFDSVSIEKIDEAFEVIENCLGESKTLNVVKEYYHTDWCFDTEGNLIKQYQSLKQGCAFASYLADVMLYDIDVKLADMARNKDGFYARYSDDILYIADDYEYAMEVLRNMLSNYGLILNPKKVQVLDKYRWFSFLGFSIKNETISLSGNKIHSIEKNIRDAVKNKTTIESAAKAVNKVFYGNGFKYSWATNNLPIINCERDITTLNSFALDNIRAAETGHKKRNDLGGLGYSLVELEGCIDRGKGKRVKKGRTKTNKIIPNYMSLNKARNALLTSRNAYDTLVRECVG